MNDVKLYITVGIPGSGKSTYSKKFVKKNKIHYLSSDELRAKFGTGEEDQSVTDIVFKHIKFKTDLYLKNGESVLIDSTAINKKNRKDFIDIAKKYNNIEIIAILFKIDLSEAKIRNNNRNRKVPEYVIDKMFKNIQQPSKEEGFNQIIYPY